MLQVKTYLIFGSAWGLQKMDEFMLANQPEKKPHFLNQRKCNGYTNNKLNVLNM
jgi:hypothetical protein